MTNTQPIELTLNAVLWLNCKDDKGNIYSQLTIEKTPRVLYDSIPIKERRFWLDEPEFVKDIEFTFKRKKYVVQVFRTKEPGEP